MATRELSLFADLDQGRMVQGFLSTLQASLPRFVFGDSIPVSFRPLKSNGNNSGNPWSEVDLTGKTVRLAIGNPAGAPSSGTYTLDYDGDTTAAISWDATGATIAAALNALASVIAAGGVTVTKASSGAFRVIFDDVGAREPITADTSALYPSSGAEIRVAVAGDGAKREIVVARLETLPAAYAELADEFPIAAASIVEVRTGSVSVGAILSLEFTVLPYSGFYSLEIGGEQTLGIPWNADASTIQAALELLSTVESGMVEVSGEFPLFTLNFDLSLGDIGEMEIDMAGLVVPKGRTGSLNTNTAGMIELLNGAAQATAKLEIELYDIGDATTWTVLQTECTVIDDVIGNAAASVTGGPVYLTSETLGLLHIGDAAPVNAVANAYATGEILFDDNPDVGAPLEVGAVTYTFKASPSVVGDVLRGADVDESVVNLQSAILGTDGLNSANAAISECDLMAEIQTLALTTSVAGVAGNGVALNPLDMVFDITSFAGGVDAITATLTPPYLRVAGGFLYVQDAGVWKKRDLSAL